MAGEQHPQQQRYDLFISYSRRDNAPHPAPGEPDGRITQLVRRIEADFAAFAGRPLTPFFDQQEIHGMQDWRQRILQGLRESRLLLACLSPDYLSSEYCQWEFNEYLKHEVGHRHGFYGVTPVYFVTIDGWGDRDYEQRCADWVRELRRRQYLDLRPWRVAGEDALKEATVQNQMAELNRQIVHTIQRGEAAERQPGSVDSHNPNFVGRTAALRVLREGFVTPGRIGVLTAVNGLGGVGKTALAVEYAHAFADQYGGGRWQVLCAGQEDLRLALSSLSTPLGFEFTDAEKADPDRQLQRVLRELRSLADANAPHRCLLLLDNVDRPALLTPAAVSRLGAGAGDWLHVLATTRLGEGELYGGTPDRTFVPVDELSAEEAITLIEKYQPNRRFASDAEWEAAKEIVRRLGCFTLAVESAAVYLGHAAPEGVTCAGFLARLQREGVEGLDAAGARSGPDALLHRERSLRATLEPTLAGLREIPAAHLALEYAALLPPDQVAVPWLRALVSQTYPEMATDADPGYPDPWLSILRHLLSLRLFQETDAADAAGRIRVVRMHRLVQEVVRLGLTAERRSERTNAMEALIRDREADLRQTTHWVDARWELEPLTALAYSKADADHASAAWLLNQAGQRWYALAEWGRCEPVMRRVVSILEASLGPEHPDVAAALNNLASLLWATNRLSEAERLMRHALDIDESFYGADHLNVAARLNNLAAMLYATNRLSEAEPLMLRALAIDEKNYGTDHPNIATALNNLAQLLQATNRLSEAEPLMLRALDIDERFYGTDHPNVTRDLNNLALLFRVTNRLSDAEPLVRRALTIDERNYGAEHPKIATDLTVLADLLYATSRLLEAEPLMRRALTIDEKFYGTDHPNVAIGLGNLASLLHATDRMSEAEPLMWHALAIDERSYGTDHTNVAVRLNNLASLLHDTNRLSEAEPLMHRVLEIFLRFLRTTGHPHPNLQQTFNNYAGLLSAMGRSLEQIYATLHAMAPEIVPSVPPS